MAFSLYSQIRQSFVAEADANSKQKFNKNVKLWKRIEVMFDKENMKNEGGSDDQMNDENKKNQIQVNGNEIEIETFLAKLL